MVRPPPAPRKPPLVSAVPHFGQVAAHARAGLTRLRPMNTPTLSQGNRLQRAYFRWAEPYYARMAPETRAEAERIDAWLYSRRGWPLWLGLLLWLSAVTLGLVMLAGLGAVESASLALGLALVILFSLLEGWIMPERFTRSDQPLWRRMRLSWWLPAAVMGSYVGFLASWNWAERGWPGPQVLALPAALFVAVGLPVLGLQWWIASVRRRRLEQQLAAARLEGERDAAARELAEARLRLLQAQVRPHFIFNTLSAVQHWVDEGDGRASPLLRSLTAFLRGATDLLGRERTTIGEEAAMVGHYLAIMQARLGGRLSSRIDVPDALAGVELPPGLLLTLVENAVEHGIEPTLAGGCVVVTAAMDPVENIMTLGVRDEGRGFADGWQEGVGLANCRQRLAQCFGSRAQLHLRQLGQGSEAVMSWPAAGSVGDPPDAERRA